MRITTFTGAQKGKEFVSLQLFYLGSPHVILLFLVCNDVIKNLN